MSLASKLAALSTAGIVCLAGGCMSVRNESSVILPGYLVNVTKGPLTGNFHRCVNTENLKRGKATEVVFFQWEVPWVSAGDEMLKSAMEEGGITELQYADYSIMHCAIIAFLNVTAYGR